MAGDDDDCFSNVSGPSRDHCHSPTSSYTGTHRNTTCHSRRLSSIASDVSTTSSRPDNGDDLDSDICFSLRGDEDDCSFSDDSPFPRELLATPTFDDSPDLLTFDDNTDASSTCSTILHPPLDSDEANDYKCYRSDSALSASISPYMDDVTPLGSPRDTPTLLEVARGVVIPLDKRVVEDESRRKKDLKSQENEMYEKVKRIILITLFLILYKLY